MTSAGKHPWMTFIEQAAGVAPSTKKLYLTNLRSLLALYGTNANLERVIQQPKETFALLSRKYDNMQTRKALVAAVKALFKYVPNMSVKYPEAQAAWHEIFKTLDHTIFNTVATAEPTQRERENWVPWEKVLEKRDSLARMEYGSVKHLLLSMYTMIEPLRGDYGNVRLFYGSSQVQPEEKNYIILPPGTPELVLNEYKTSEKYGEFRRSLPIDLVKIILRSLAVDPRNHLFVDDFGRPYEKKNSFVKFTNRVLHKIFGKNFTIRMLRHSFISSLDFNERTPAELIKHSHNMLHSVAQQQLYRRKVDESTPLTLPPQQRVMPSVVKVDGEDSDDEFVHPRAQGRPNVNQQQRRQVTGKNGSKWIII